MSDELIIFEFIKNNNKINNIRRQKRRLTREQSDPFYLEDREFIKRYRLSKQLVLELCDELRPLMKNPSKSTDLTVETKVKVKLLIHKTKTLYGTLK